MHVEGFLSNWKTLVGGMNWRNFLYPLLLCGKLNFASSQETSISAVSVFVKAISISSYYNATVALLQLSIIIGWKDENCNKAEYSDGVTSSHYCLSLKKSR